MERQCPQVVGVSGVELEIGHKNYFEYLESLATFGHLLLRRETNLLNQMDDNKNNHLSRNVNYKFPSHILQLLVFKSHPVIVSSFGRSRS